MIRFSTFVLLCTLLLTGCAGSKRQTAGGGYYKDDGPGRAIPANIAAIPDAVPKIEAYAAANKRPYSVLGKRYTPVSLERPFKQVGVASWYGRKFHGKKTANGEVYDMYAMTAAHPTLPLPSYARVTHADSGKSVIVRINDRGPFHSSRIIDLSYVAAAKLDLIAPGSGQVVVEAITHEDIRTQAYLRGPAAPVQTQAVLTAQAAPPAATVTTAHQQTPARSEHSGTEDALSALIMQASSGSDSADPSAAPTPSRPVASQQVAHNADATAVFLQFGAFSAKESAAGFARRLNTQIAHIEARRAEVASSPDLHRVRIGPYDSRAHAVNAALRIQAETGHEAAYVVDRPWISQTALSL